MKAAKDSTRTKGNYDGPTLGQSSCFGRKKIGKWEHFVESVIKNTNGQLQVIGYGALSAKLQCIPSFVIGSSGTTTNNLHAYSEHSRSVFKNRIIHVILRKVLVLSSNIACVYLDKFKVFWLIRMIIF